VAIEVWTEETNAYYSYQCSNRVEEKSAHMLAHLFTHIVGNMYCGCLTIDPEEPFSYPGKTDECE